MREGVRPVDGAAGHKLAAMRERLWREDPEEVGRIYHTILMGNPEGSLPEGGNRHDVLSARMRKMRRPMLYRRKRGLTLQDIATIAGLERATLAALMVHREYLELVPYGGSQRRRLVTERAFYAGLGHNADGSHLRIARLEGMGRAVVFPVFYPERVSDILWSLDHAGIVAGASSIGGKRERMKWLLHHHGYLPDAELAKLGGYSLIGVKKARKSSAQVQGPA